MYELLAIVLGVAAIHSFYRLIESSWPQNYMSMEDYSSYEKSLHPIGYSLFRFGPVLAASLFVAVSLDRGSGTAWIGSIGVGVAHAAGTSGRAFVSTLRAKQHQRRLPLLVMHAALTLLIVGTAAIALPLRSSLSRLVPELDQVAGEIWGAILAATLATFLIRNTGHRHVAVEELISGQERRIDEQLLQLAEEEAIRYEIDPQLFQAILITENLQRPRWFRRLERVKGLFLREGTYGIMQISAERPIDDAESIRRAARSHLRGMPVPMVQHNPRFDPHMDRDRLKAQLAPYNPREAWQSMVVDVLAALRYSKPGHPNERLSVNSAEVQRTESEPEDKLPSSPQPGTYNWTQHPELGDGRTDRMTRKVGFLLDDAPEDLVAAIEDGVEIGIALRDHPETVRLLAEVSGVTRSVVYLREADVGRSAGGVGFAIEIAESLATAGGAGASLVGMASLTKSVYEMLAGRSGSRPLITLGAAEHLAIADAATRYGGDGFDVTGSGDLCSTSPDRAYTGGDSFFIVLRDGEHLLHYHVSAYGEVFFIGESPAIGSWMDPPPELTDADLEPEVGKPGEPEPNDD